MLLMTITVFILAYFIYLLVHFIYKNRYYIYRWKNRWKHRVLEGPHVVIFKKYFKIIIDWIKNHEGEILDFIIEFIKQYLNSSNNTKTSEQKKKWKWKWKWGGWR